MNKKAKFWLFFLLGICIFMPFILFFIIVQVFVYAILYFGAFFIYCYFNYRFVYKKVEPKYPLVPPEGRMTDYYFPRSRIPRPIYEDVRRYPEFFGKKKRKYKRRRVKKKS